MVARADAKADTVLVTGGASGLGRAVAEAVREAGWRPVVLDRQPVEGFDHELVDVADSGRAEAVVRGVADRSGGLDAVVTAAGIDACGPLERVPREDWERVVAAMAPLLRHGRFADALHAGLAMLGKVLAAKGFAGRLGRENELPDGSIEEQGPS